MGSPRAAAQTGLKTTSTNPTATRIRKKIIWFDQSGQEPNKPKRHLRTKLRDHTAEENLFIRRALIAFGGVILLTLILLLNLARLQIFNYGYYSTRSNENRIKLIPTPPIRGIIYDRNGIALAVNNITYQLQIIPDRITNIDQQLKDLQSVVDLTDEEIENFKKERRNYRSYNPVPLKSNLTDDEIARFAVNQHRFPYVSINAEQHRYYPYGATLTHIVGYVSKINEQDKQKLSQADKLNEYVGTTNIGKLGIERYYEDILHGKPGYQEVEVNSRGRVVRELKTQPPQVGKDIYLTIDLKLQQYIERLLNGRRAAVVALDPNNGEVLALVSSPSYDPNLFVGGISGKDYRALLTNPDKPLFNRATQGAYPPASTVKPFIAIAALTSGVITPKTAIHDVGWWQLPNTNRRYRDWLRGGHGRVDVVRAIESSVDTFFYQVAYQMGIDQLSNWMQQFGYGQRTGLDLSTSEESSANMPTRAWKMQRYKRAWLQGDTIPVGIGQGYWTATPVQMAKALTILINNGTIYTPHALLKVQNNEVLSAKSFIKNQPMLSQVDPESWDLAKKGMYKVLYGSAGTARRIFARTPYKAAGKSGTAQVYGLKADEVYNASKIPEHLRDHALFIAYAPFDQPKIALAIVLENGGGGSSSGGSIARQILDYYLLGIDSTVEKPKKTIRKRVTVTDDE